VGKVFQDNRECFSRGNFMRICLLGEFDVELDEAMRKTAFYLHRYLSEEHDVLGLNPRNIISFRFWKDLKEFNPSYVHYVSGSSLISFIILKIVSVFTGSRSIISMMRPTFSKISLKMIKLFRPDVVIVQSPETEKKFEDLNFRTVFLPIVGMDFDRFHPSLKKRRDVLRKRFKLDTDDFLVLHVGSIKEGRNINWLLDLQEMDGVQVLIVGAVSQGLDKNLLNRLKEAGCTVFNSYFENVEEIYALSDCYAFPVVPKENFMGKSGADCIDMPLSVLEAMSCNLPVVSTKFGGLTRIFSEGDGLIFADDIEEFMEAVKYFKESDARIETRKKVEMYSWAQIAGRIENVYREA